MFISKNVIKEFEMKFQWTKEEGKFLGCPSVSDIFRKPLTDDWIVWFHYTLYSDCCKIPDNEIIPVLSEIKMTLKHAGFSSYLAFHLTNW